jgi:hypothetical protein
VDVRIVVEVWEGNLTVISSVDSDYVMTMPPVRTVSIWTPPQDPQDPRPNSTSKTPNPSADSANGSEVEGEVPQKTYNGDGDAATESEESMVGWTVEKYKQLGWLRQRVYGACVFTMDSAVLGLGLLGCSCCTVRVFEQDFALEDAIGTHARSLEALPCVRPMAFLSVVHCLLPLPP